MSAYISYSSRGGSGGGGVISLNSLSGALTLAAGSGITIASDGISTLTISATGAGFANTALSNLASTAVNVSIVSNIDQTINLGSAAKLWLTGYFNTVQTKSIDSGNTLNLAVDTYARGLYANDGTTLLLDFSSPTGPDSITQSPGDNTTKVATTAFVTSAVGASGITALTGDGTATGPGSAALTLATVNTNVGTFGSATQVGRFTVNGKGLITAASNVSIQIAESQVTGLVSDLSAKADLASPVFSGIPQAPTAAPGTNNTQLATTAFVTTAGGSFANTALSNLAATTAINSDLLPTADFSNHIGSASHRWFNIYALASYIPSIASTTTNRVVMSTTTYTLNATSGATIIDFNDILGATTVTQSANNNSTRIATTAYVDTGLALKSPLASPTFTGVPAAPTAAAGTNTTQLATTAFVHTEFATTASYAAPTIQVFTSSSGTYTTPTSPRTPRYLKIRAIGGGGGGGGAGTASAGNGGIGGNTTFGSSLLTANGGGGGANGGAVIAGPSGGSATVTTSGTVLQLAALTGASGSGVAGVAGDGGPPGAATPFGGGGGGGQGQNAAGTGLSAAANTGAGGGAAGGGSAYGTGCSGAAGGFLEAIITSPSATYAYVVGAAGTAGAAGTSGAAGGAGGSGIIIVEEYYQ